jgi:cation diffusion facilitator family transporter
MPTVLAAQTKAELRFAMNLSLGIGLMMFALKMSAYWLTGSAAILSDAAESVVHVVAVGFAAYSLRLSEQPADASHLYGHAKISFFSAGFEGAMIVLAALFIIGSAISKWLHGLTLENLGWGTIITAVAATINGGLGGYLLWLGRKRKSLILEANGKHVLTDCWTSLGVLAALGMTALTGWLPWDPIFAIALALNILFSGVGLMRRSLGGLMDSADPEVHGLLERILAEHVTRFGIQFHSLRHRNVGDAHWVEVHLLFPKGTPIDDAHQIATEIEQTIESSVEPAAQVITHLEPMEGHEDAHPHRPH